MNIVKQVILVCTNVIVMYNTAVPPHCIPTSSDTLCCLSVDARPVVTVSFVTEFDGHISVAMDAELILWLHDVVTSYVREKDSQKSE